MPLQIACSKGCGHIINVPDEQIEESVKLGSPLVVAHEVCPTEEGAPQRKFKATWTVQEWLPTHPVTDEDKYDWETVVSMGAEVEAGSFQIALPEIQKGLEQQWGRIVGMAQMVDQEYKSSIPSPNKPTVSEDEGSDGESKPEAKDN